MTRLKKDLNEVGPTLGQSGLGLQVLRNSELLLALNWVGCANGLLAFAQRVFEDQVEQYNPDVVQPETEY